jgi:hypothetical protein
MFVVKRPVPKWQPVRGQVARQILFRQRRPLIRQFRLAADQNYPAREAFTAQGIDGLGSGLAAAYDEDCRDHCVLSVES